MSQNISTLHHITAGFTAVLVGYTSSVVIILQAATAAGASPAQIESWLLALGVTMGVTSIGFSWYYKMPILTAWSTPGAAILVSSAAEYDMSALIGAFVVSGLMIVITGLVSPLARALQRIPTPLATAMLGAILLPFCVRAFEPAMTTPYAFLWMFLTFIASKRFVPKYTMLLLLVVGCALAFSADGESFSNPELSIAQASWVTPMFDWSAMLNISLPLYIVTMLSQNLPGVAMMKSYQYETPVKPVLVGTGLANVLSAPFGGFSVNLAAISAAICMNDDVDSDKSKRYKAVIWAGVFYLIAGLLASVVVSMFLAFPKEITHMLAGFALLGTLMMCLQSAFDAPDYREPALLVLVVTLSGVTILGINATLWGLIVGWGYASLFSDNKIKGH
ncbi:benzoate transport protein [Vibrio variabilis]|uniref:Benzoate transport protein n=1 Tax=Vibrio variabilis TaxID=990271 RepID=A0ABQ0JHX8_9VIBR|nr:benzoate transport protein [Vibrio variabilis]